VPKDKGYLTAVFNTAGIMVDFLQLAAN